VLYAVAVHVGVSAWERRRARRVDPVVRL
jgi:hypothetical protein